MSGMSQRIAATTNPPAASAVAIPASTLFRGGLLGALRGPVAPEDYALEPALRAVELEGQEREPEDDRDDARPRHARARHHDAGAHDQNAGHHDRCPVDDVALFVALLALAELDDELRSVVVRRRGCVLRRHASELKASPRAAEPRRSPRAARARWLGGRSPAHLKDAGSSRGSSARSAPAAPARVSSPRPSRSAPRCALPRW